MGDISVLLEDVNARREGAWDALLSAVYTELRALAERRMQRESPNHTLQTSALLNEAYIKLVRGDTTWQNRAHFFGAAARAMQQILTDHWRRKQALKAGGGARPLSMDDSKVAEILPKIAVTDGFEVSLERFFDQLDEMMLTESMERSAAAVLLNGCLGLSLQDTAKLLEVSVSTVKRELSIGKAWLVSRLEEV